MNGLIQFGTLSPKDDVTTSVELKALDGRHFFCMEEDGERTGWTTMNSPGATMIHTGEDLNVVPEGSDPPEGICEKEAFVILAENGDIQLKAANGRIRMEAHDIEIVATGQPPHGNVLVNGYENVKIDSKNVTIDGKQSYKLVTTGLLTLGGLLGTQIISPLVTGITAATIKDIMPKPGKGIE
ncbi:MAG: hypothetical protein CMB64_00460 [Euryarchaeota archaeon]|nr:hypothetical protein [Euryarchaeota archaeon]